MKSSNGAITTLFLLAACSEGVPGTSSGIESRPRGLGTIPASESATWRKVGFRSTPDPVYLQAAAFDSARQVVVMFGGTKGVVDGSGNPLPPNQETWEWSPTTGKWTELTGTGRKPTARSGAVMVYDSKRAKFVLFGGRAGGGFNYQDTWELDPATALWTDVTSAGVQPPARSQAGMVYQASTGKILLFGGGRSDTSSNDVAAVMASAGDTWELDPATHVWSALKPALAPSARHDLGLVWDSNRNKAVLFGGVQVDIPGVPGIPKQDTWEWDPATAEWQERTGAGSKPASRYGHAMAFDASRGKVVMLGGLVIDSGVNAADLWEWTSTTGAWTRRMTGAETPMPAPRRYASLFFDEARARLELLVGAASFPQVGPDAIAASAEVWELDPSKPAFTDRTVVIDGPGVRTSPCMAYNPSTDKVYLFGGYHEITGEMFDDLWAWDGKTWSRIAADKRPPARFGAAMAFDPARRSLILFGGGDNDATLSGRNDTWEWNPSSGWTRLSPATSPAPLIGPGMVTDSTRNKILLFGGSDYGNWVVEDPTRNEVWEWDGALSSWTNRTPASPNQTPQSRNAPPLAYDSGRQKLFLYDGGTSLGIGGYWEWDPLSAGWMSHDTGDARSWAYATAVVYDSIRRRAVLLAQGPNADPAKPENQTWELDSNSQTLYVRSVASPGSGVMAFDSARGVVVLFGGPTASGHETWEYRVNGLGNGEGCTPAFAASCASGFCADNVCCEAAACTGPCKSCNVRGSEGKCVLAEAGTEVPGSCSSGQVCDGHGGCMLGNGQPCTTASACASGVCADGVCCDKACDGVCVACHQAGQVGRCGPFAAGTDPQRECGKGAGVCASACDGVGACGFPRSHVSCGKCMGCDGTGACSVSDPACYPGPSSDGGPDGATGDSSGTGGSGGIDSGSGGSAGTSVSSGGSMGTGVSSHPSGGTGGAASIGSGGSINLGGVAGTTTLGGSGGPGGSRGGSTTSSASSVGAGGAVGSGGTLLAGGAGGGRDGGVAMDGGSAKDAGPSVRRASDSGCSCGLARTAGSRSPAPWLVSSVILLLLARTRWPRRRSVPLSPRHGGPR
jgi:hypothetical protein